MTKKQRNGGFRFNLASKTNVYRLDSIVSSTGELTGSDPLMLMLTNAPMTKLPVLLSTTHLPIRSGMGSEYIVAYSGAPDRGGGTSASCTAGHIRQCGQ